MTMIISLGRTNSRIAIFLQPAAPTDRRDMLHLSRPGVIVRQCLSASEGRSSSVAPSSPWARLLRAGLLRTLSGAVSPIGHGGCWSRRLTVVSAPGISLQLLELRLVVKSFVDQTVSLSWESQPYISLRYHFGSDRHACHEICCDRAKNFTSHKTLHPTPFPSQMTVSGAALNALSAEDVPLRTGPPTREELLVHYPAKFTWTQLKTFVNSG